MGWLATSSSRSVRDLGGGTVLDIEQVEFQTTPTGIGGGYGVPLDSWLSGAGDALISTLADELEGLASSHHVVAGSYALDLDRANLLTDFEDLIVGYDRSSQGLPALYGTVRVPVQAFFTAETGIGGLIIPGTSGASPASLVDAEYQRLATLAQGG